MSQQHDSSHPDGVYDEHNGTSPGLERAQHRKGIAAMEAWLRTRSWSMAAELAGYPHARAAKVAAEKALESEWKDSPRSQSHMRQAASMHLGLLMRSVATKATDPKDPEHLAAVKIMSGLIAQDARLFGLDAPTRVQIDATTQQIEDFLDRNVGPRNEEEETNIFEGEVVEDSDDERPALEA